MKSYYWGIIVALFLFPACREQETEAIDFEQTPVQIVHDMQILQTEKGEAQMRMRAPVMEKYDYVKDSVQQAYELYPDGFYVDAYTENGEL